jgi:hypothetical protein
MRKKKEIGFFEELVLLLEASLGLGSLWWRSTKKHMLLLFCITSICYQTNTGLGFRSGFIKKPYSRSRSAKLLTLNQFIKQQK